MILLEENILDCDEHVFSPLSDIRVLGVTVFLAGPYTMVNLARLGAEAIKVEIPGTGDPVRGNGPFATQNGYEKFQTSPQHLSTRFLKRSQGLKSITLNLKDECGKKMFLDLAKNSDVLVENLSPGSMSKLGLGYKEVSEVNSEIIYASISGYGQTGKYSAHKAHDPQIQGMSGIMDINGYPDGPPTRIGFYIGDLVTPVFACYSILAALKERDKTGKGQHIDVSMMDTLTSLMLMDNLEELINEQGTLRQGNGTRTGPTGLYHLVDGDITITVASDDQWERLSKALNRPDFLSDPRFSTFDQRNRNVTDAKEEIQKSLSIYSRKKALDLLEIHGVPSGVVRSVDEVIEDSHFWDRKTLLSMRSSAFEDPVPGIASGFPVKFSYGELPDLDGAPVLGVNNQEVFEKLLNLKVDDLIDLEKRGII